MPEPRKIKSSRREFFARSAQAAALFGVGGVSARAATTSFSTFQLATAFPSEAKAVRGLATGPNDQIYIAADREVRIFTAGGRAVRIIPLDAAPTCVAVRKNGDMLIGFREHIEVFSEGGNREEVWPILGNGAALTNIAVAEGGDVFAADGGNQVIWRLDSAGKVLRKIERDGGGFSVPEDFFPIATRDNDVVVANLGRHRIETITEDGKMVSSWGRRSRSLEGFGGCCNPISLAVTPDGRYVTAEGGLPRIKLFDVEGNFEELIAGPDEFEANARGSHENTPGVSVSCHTGGLEVAVDSRSRVIVLDRVTAEVRVFARV